MTEAERKARKAAYDRERRARKKNKFPSEVQDAC